MLRTVYESLAMKYRMVSEQISRVSGLPSSVIHIVGGGSRNAFLNQLTANACGLKVVAGPEEATAVGNAMVQAMGLGVFKRMHDSKAMIRAAFPIKEFMPKEHEIWERAYVHYQTVVK
jgi:sugar (pentulose or hexulose) kinase